jgi:hypothetical protein
MFHELIHVSHPETQVLVGDVIYTATYFMALGMLVFWLIDNYDTCRNASKKRAP